MNRVDNQKIDRLAPTIKLIHGPQFPCSPDDKAAAQQIPWSCSAPTNDRCSVQLFSISFDCFASHHHHTRYTGCCWSGWRLTESECVLLNGWWVRKVLNYRLRTIVGVGIHTMTLIKFPLPLMLDGDQIRRAVDWGLRRVRRREGQWESHTIC